ncbi:hypothetical protein V2S84_08955, partial [Azotobacter chroococcum]|nr:hypothetical protein [Azotobacter chroococcum]
MATVNEILADEAVGHAVDLQQYSAGVLQRMVALLNRTDSDLAAELSAALERLPADSFTVERLELLLESVRDLNASAYSAVLGELETELQALAEYEAGYQLQLFEEVIPEPVQVRFPIASVTPAQVYAAAMSRPFQGRLLRDWASQIEAGRMAKIREAVRVGYLEGETASQIVRRIRGTRDEKYADGILQRPRRDLMAVVQTAIGHTASVAREQFVEANQDIIKAERWVSTLDNRTSAQCRIRDRLQYTTGTHKPIGHKIPWLQGPGKIHWNAITAGSLITTSRGQVAIEDVCIGDLVLTHTGSFKPVTDKLSKRNEGGVIRVARTESGRVLRATDDHPILTAGTGWKFMGALEVGDKLFCDPEQLPEVRLVAGAVVSDAKDRPSLSDERQVALDRTLQLVASVINLESHPEIGPCEVEDKAVEIVLSNPAIIEGKCALHHLLALAELLGKLGCERLGQLLHCLSRRSDSAHSLGLALVESSSLFGGHDLGDDFWVSSRVIGGHAVGVGCVHGAVLLGRPESPMLVAGRSGPASALEVGADLLDLGSDRVSHDLGVPGKRAVGESMLSLYGAKGKPLLDVLNQDELAMVGERFGHDRILALELSHYDSIVYDLGV